MPLLVWFVLNNGRSIIANCEGATREALKDFVRSPGSMFTFTSDDAVDKLPSTEIRDFVLFDSKMKVPPTAAIYHFVQFAVE